MDRRKFLAGSIGWSLAACAGEAFAQSGPLTRIIFPFAAGGSGDMLCRQLAQYLPPAARPQRHRREPYRRRRADRHTGGEGRGPRYHHRLVTTGPTMYCCRWWRTSRASTRAKDFVPSRSWPASNSWSLRPIDRRHGFQAIGGLDQGQSRKASYGVPSSGTIPHFTGCQLEKALGLSMTRVRIAARRRSSPISSAGTFHSPSRRCRTPSRNIAPAASASWR